MNGGNDLMREAARLHVVRLGNVTTAEAWAGAPEALAPADALAPASPAAASGLARRQQAVLGSIRVDR